MLTKFTLLPLLAAGLFLFTGCKKENTISNTQNLLGTWVVTGISSNTPNDWNYDGYEETDIFNTYSYCQRDIALTFDSNGYGQSRQGCDAPWENMSWQLSNNNGQLDIYIPSGDIHLTILQFDGKTIRGNDQVQDNGRNYTITYTLSKR